MLSGPSSSSLFIAVIGLPMEEFVVWPLPATDPFICDTDQGLQFKVCKCHGQLLLENFDAL